MENKKLKPEVATHADLSENIEDVVEDLFGELNDDLDMSRDIDEFEQQLNFSERSPGPPDEILWSEESREENSAELLESSFNLVTDEQPAAEPLAASPPAPAAAPFVAAPPGPGSAEKLTLEEVEELFPSLAEHPADLSHIPEEFLLVVQSNMKLLDNCVDRMGMLETLFRENSGYGKLYDSCKNLRQLLEYQQDALRRALKGDFSDTEPPQLRPVRRWKVIRKPKSVAAVTASCPWKVLQVGKWHDSLVGFVPEQVAYISEEAIIKTSKFAGQDFFALKNLKKMPWAKLSSIFNGKLAELEENELNELELPILKHPGVLQAFNEPPAKSYLLVLYHENGGGGGVAFLDAKVKDVMVSPHWGWKAETVNDSGIAGYLLTDGLHLPVVRIAGKETLLGDLI